MGYGQTRTFALRRVMIDGMSRSPCDKKRPARYRPELMLCPTERQSSSDETICPAKWSVLHDMIFLELQATVYWSSYQRAGLRCVITGKNFELAA